MASDPSSPGQSSATGSPAAAMPPAGSWKRRASLFLQRFWQPTVACATCMPGSLEKLLSLSHWSIALQTGVVTGVLAVLVSFTPLGRLYRMRFGNALLIGILTAIGDAYSHWGRSGFGRFEALVTGAVSAAIALVASYLLEDRALRLRAAWARVTRRR